MKCNSEIAQICIEDGKMLGKIETNWAKHLSKFAKIKAKAVGWTFRSAMMAAPVVQKLQKGENSAQLVAVEALMSVAWMARSDPEASKWGFARGLSCGLLWILIFEGCI